MASFDQGRCFLRWWSARVARHNLEGPRGHDETLSLVQLRRGRHIDKNGPATQVTRRHSERFLDPLLGLHDNVDQTKLEPLQLWKNPFPDQP